MIEQHISRIEHIADNFNQYSKESNDEEIKKEKQTLDKLVDDLVSNEVSNIVGNKEYLNILEALKEKQINLYQRFSVYYFIELINR